MGLLGESWDDPRTMGLLALAQGIQSKRGMGGVTEGLLARGEVMQAAKQNKLLEDMKRAQMEQAQFQMEQQRADAAKRAQIDALIKQSGGDLSKFGQGLASIDPIQAINVQASLRKDNTPITLAPGAKLVEPGSYRELATNPKEPSQSPIGELIAEMNALPPGDPRRAIYQQAISKATTHAPALSVSYGAPVAGQDASGNPVFFQPSKTGGAPAIIPGVKPADGGKLTEAESKASAYLEQMRSATSAMGGVQIDPTNRRSQLEVAAAGNVLGNFAVSPSAQQARQAQEQWAEAFLRYKTGAAATKDEVALNVRTFFPQPGDSPAVIEQKRRARAQAEHSVSIGAGRGASRVQNVTPADDGWGIKLVNP